MAAMTVDEHDAGGGPVRAGGAGRVPARYDPRHRYLLTVPGDAVELTVVELDALVAGGLPPNARAHEHGWWSNNPRHGYARTWVAAGWQVATGGVHPRTRAMQTMRFERAAPRPLDLDQLQRQRSMRERWMSDATRRKPDEVHVKAGWHLPHMVYQVHLPDRQRFKVGVSRVGANRLAALGAGRDVVTVDIIEAPSRFHAELVEIAVLRLTDPWRIRFPEHHDAGGYTEMWSDDGPTVDLAVVAHELSEVGGPTLRAAAPPSGGSGPDREVVLDVARLGREPAGRGHEHEVGVEQHE